MSKENKKGDNQRPSNVVDLPRNCLDESCNAKGKRAGFCEEHYAWFKEGLLKKDGSKPKDFEKKMIQFNTRQQRKSA